MRGARFVIPLLLLVGCNERGGGPEGGSSGSEGGSDTGSGGAGAISLEVIVPPGAQPGPQATLVVTIYGHDPMFADASASVIQTDEVPLAAMTNGITIDLPADAHERIDQGNGPVAFADARYYLVFYGDLDGDRQICGGELIQDHDAGGPYDFGPGAPDETVKIAMRITDATFSCRSAYPDGM